MPPTRYFVVTQERQVRVAAVSVVDAALCASNLFAGMKNTESTAEASSLIVDRKLSVEEDR